MKSRKDKASANLTEDQKEFLMESLRVRSNINDCISKAFKKNEIEISIKDKSFFVFQSALIGCNAALSLFERNEENEKWLNLYRTHEAWKKSALEGPLTSNYVKEIIRNNTKTKKIYQWNHLTSELAKCLKDAFIYLTHNKILKKEEARFFLLELLTQCFPQSSTINALTDETFKKAMQRI